jgi:tetratricopeptide (TPR) repeat protein
LIEATRAYDRGDLDVAAELIRNTVALPDAAPAESDVVTYLAIRFQQSKHDDCIEFAEGTALSLFPGSSRILEFESLCLWSTGRKDEAAAIAERVVTVRPTAFALQQILGDHYLNSAPKRASQHFERYFRYRPVDLAEDDGMPLLKLGICYLATDDGRRAVDKFREVRDRFAKRQRWVINANNGLCAAYVRNRRFAKAIDLCETIVANPRHVDRRGSAWFNLAAAYLATGRVDDARRAADEFLRVHPKKHDKVRRLFRETQAPEPKQE